MSDSLTMNDIINYMLSNCDVSDYYTVNDTECTDITFYEPKMKCKE